MIASEKSHQILSDYNYLKKDLKLIRNRFFLHFFYIFYIRFPFFRLLFFLYLLTWRGVLKYTKRCPFSKKQIFIWGYKNLEIHQKLSGSAWNCQAFSFKAAFFRAKVWSFSFFMAIFWLFSFFRQSSDHNHFLWQNKNFLNQNRVIVREIYF